MTPIISVEGLGKRYLIGHAVPRGDSSFRDMLSRNARRLARAARDTLRGQMIVEGDEIEEIWALRDVMFSVEQGEVVGVIGRNGAGKSTLLKILSRIVEPTTGSVRIRGRVASLLEVGTGFHPELSGRENIFLNGAVLGMSREEVRRKFDEIVAFAEVERFLDTPVKRYSSGMYVRLAFAVAAHLEPEILIVDEVLAVGDAEFQQKCLGKMKTVAATDGRTVLFVSHNMSAVATLTTRAILLDGGHLVDQGASAALVDRYLARSGGPGAIEGKGEHTRIHSATLVDEAGAPTNAYQPGSVLRVRLTVETDGTAGLSIELLLRDPAHRVMGISSLHQFHGAQIPARPGRYRYDVALKPMWLAAGRYCLDAVTSVTNVKWDHYVERALEFDVRYSSPGGLGWDFRHDQGFGAIALLSETPPRFDPLPLEALAR